MLTSIYPHIVLQKCPERLFLMRLLELIQGKRNMCKKPFQGYNGLLMTIGTQYIGTTFVLDIVQGDKVEKELPIRIACIVSFLCFRFGHIYLKQLVFACVNIISNLPVFIQELTLHPATGTGAEEILSSNPRPLARSQPLAICYLNPSYAVRMGINLITDIVKRPIETNGHNLALRHAVTWELKPELVNPRSRRLVKCFVFDHFVAHTCSIPEAKTRASFL